MKGQGADLARIKTVIEGDRRNVSCDVEKMLAYDLNCVLDGYFDYATRPEVVVTPVKGALRVDVSFIARRVKSAGITARSRT